LVVLEVATEQVLFFPEPLVASDGVDGAVLGRGHEPGTGLFGDAAGGPRLEGDDQRVLGEFFGEADVPHHPRESGDEAGRLDAPDGVDRPVGGGLRHP